MCRNMLMVEARQLKDSPLRQKLTYYDHIRSFLVNELDGTLWDAGHGSNSSHTRGGDLVSFCCVRRGYMPQGPEDILLKDSLFLNRWQRPAYRECSFEVCSKRSRVVQCNVFTFCNSYNEPNSGCGQSGECNPATYGFNSASPNDRTRFGPKGGCLSDGR